MKHKRSGWILAAAATAIVTLIAFATLTARPSSMPASWVDRVIGNSDFEVATEAVWIRYYHRFGVKITVVVRPDGTIEEITLR